MGFKGNGQRAAYFEALRQTGNFNPKQRGPGLHPTSANGQNTVGTSPALSPTMPPANVNMNSQLNGQMAAMANPLKPLNPAGGNKFNRVKKFF